MPNTFYCSQLQDLSLIKVVGEDAADFLHRQLTQSITDLDTSSIRLAGACSVQGRLLATMHVWREEQAIALLLSHNIVQSFITQLSKYILRSKVKFEVSNFAIYALLGSSSALKLKLHELGATLPQAQQWARCDNTCVLRFTDIASQSRLLCLVPEGSQQQILLQQDGQQNMEHHPAAWHEAEIASGIARISEATQNLFIPQMLYYDHFNGVDFKKGCYPGQEIIARTQYRGQIKRHIYRISAPEAMAPGMPIFHAETEREAGIIVNATPLFQQSSLGLAVIHDEDLKSGYMRLASGTHLTVDKVLA